MLLAAAVLALAACGEMPYRKAGFEPIAKCRELYDAHDDITDRLRTPPEVLESRCWMRAHEDREDYDLLVVEFDDQGWVRDSSELARPAKEDYLDSFFDQLARIYHDNQSNGLSLVLFVHGWHHNADARDKNVTQFRWLLRDLAIAENGRRLTDVKTTRPGGPRVVGIYVGWRGESITLPLVKHLTFWERKTTAARVAQGSVRELFTRLDFFRDRARTNVEFKKVSLLDRDEDGRRNVSLLTIGHSFGGLIAFEALSNEFVRAAARNTGEDYVSRVGDLVVIVNPAVEGARYEPLMVAGQRMGRLRGNQLPVAIVATSTGDWATKYAFRWAREVSTFFERTDGPQLDAIVKAVGHNERYTTHVLSSCDPKDTKCAAACPTPAVQMRQSTKGLDMTEQRAYTSQLARDIQAESKLMRVIGSEGFRGRPYLCGGLHLTTTAKHWPENNPFWVVQTTGDIVEGHNDIFNPRFVSFIRQMYLAVISERFR
jgi:hypothetical protein